MAEGGHSTDEDFATSSNYIVNEKAAEKFGFKGAADQDLTNVEEG